MKTTGSIFCHLYEFITYLMNQQANLTIWKTAILSTLPACYVPMCTYLKATTVRQFMKTSEQTSSETNSSEPAANQVSIIDLVAPNCIRVIESPVSFLHSVLV